MADYKPDYRAQALGGQISTQMPVPKEIGLLQRVDGVLSGLDDLGNRLENLSARLFGDRPKSAGVEASPDGLPLPSKLSVIENRLRACLSEITNINDAL